MYGVKDNKNDSFYNTKTKIMLNKNDTAAGPEREYKILEKEIN